MWGWACRIFFLPSGDRFRARFSVRAEGFALTYQWQKDGVDLPSETDETLVIHETRSTLALNPVVPSHAGDYDVVLIAACGTATLGSYTFLTRRFGPPRVEDKELRCRKCHYILRGITEPRCPECGESI